ncbi:MAG: hypothetical protein HYV76_02585 [Candidatus Vogelbacteria bacterium]|nr:hypothetical protein [Candidatus Vogelbacteria bacterium]
MRAYLIFTILFVLMALPVSVLGQTDPDWNGLIPCEGIESCHFGDLMKLANTLMKFLIVDIATPLAVVGFAWAGIKIVLNPGNDGARKEAKAIFTNTLIGFALALGAYAIVKAIAVVFIKTSVVNL